jgi:hypothetical protein
MREHMMIGEKHAGGEQHPALLALPERIGQPVAIEPTTDSMQQAAA